LLFRSRAVARISDFHFLRIALAFIRVTGIAGFRSLFIGFRVVLGLSRHIGGKHYAVAINQPIYVGHVSSSAVAVNRDKRPEKPFSSYACGGTPASRRS
jgi:hypothetical protein